jgi:hypothetical protein
MSTVDKLAVYQQPVLLGFWTGAHPKPLDLRNQALRAAHAIRRGEDPRAWPHDLLERWAGLARPPEQPRDTGVDLTDIEVVPSQHAGWDLEVWIPEGAEQELGRDRFSMLLDRLTEIEAFGEVAWEDREVFLVRLAAPIAPETAVSEVTATIQALADG